MQRCGEPLQAGEWVTLSAAARAVGRHRQQLQRLVADGRLAGFLRRGADGRQQVLLDGLAAHLDAVIRERSDSPRAKVRQRAASAVAEPIVERIRREVEAIPDDELPPIAVSRARSEHLRAELLTLDLGQQQSRLLDADTVQRTAFDLGRMVRDRLLTLPNRLAPTLAATLDARDVHRVLDAELREALSVLATDAATSQSALVG